MSEFLARLFMYGVGVIWMWLILVRTILGLIMKGPRKLFYKSDSAPPSQLSDPSYGEHRYISVGRVKLHYVVSGPSNAPFMLMLHGFPEIWYSWRYQIKEFQKDFRVVAVDLRGFGDSDKPKGVKNYRMQVLIEDIRQFISALGYKSCVLLAHDWGGGLAWAFTAKHPEVVDRLVIMNIPPVPIWRRGFTSYSKPVQFLASGYIYAFQLPFLPEFTNSLGDNNMLEEAFRGKIFGVRSGIMTKDDVECYKYYFRRPGAWTAAINYYRANLSVPGYKHELSYPMPVKIIWGCKDMALTMSLLDDIIKAIPQVDVTKIEEASHWVQMDQPEKVCKSIRQFLQSTGYGKSK